MDTSLVKLVLFAPTTHADAVRKAMGDAGAGRMGNYSHSTFSTQGHGRFMPLEGARPAVGEVGRFEIVEEERIETLCRRDKVNGVIEAVRKVHPYEEFDYDLIALLSIDDL